MQKKQLEMYSDALKHYESAYTSFKNHPDFLEEYGYFLLEEGMRKEAKEVFTQLIQLDPTQIHIEELLYNLEDFFISWKETECRFLNLKRKEKDRGGT